MVSIVAWTWFHRTANQTKRAGSEAFQIFEKILGYRGSGKAPFANFFSCNIGANLSVAHDLGKPFADANGEINVFHDRMRRPTMHAASSGHLQNIQEFYTEQSIGSLSLYLLL